MGTDKVGRPLCSVTVPTTSQVIHDALSSISATSGINQNPKTEERCRTCQSYAYKGSEDVVKDSGERVSITQSALISLEIRCFYSSVQHFNMRTECLSWSMKLADRRGTIQTLQVAPAHNDSSL